MTEAELITLAEAAGFSAAVIPAAQVPVDEKFRPYCEENLCGQYNANYSCPPVCGSAEQLHREILRGELAVILKSEWPIESYQDFRAIRRGKQSHNRAMLRLKETLRMAGYDGLCVGGSCCDLCDPCNMASGRPCAFPERRFSCMSAYCVDVAKLTRQCGLDFAWDTKKLHLCGMIVLRKP